MNEFFYINNKSISKELCADIINLFENEENKYKGITISGLNTNVKDTFDFVIPHISKKWEKIYKFLNNEISINIIKYFNYLNNNFDFTNPNQKTDQVYKFFEKKNFYYNFFLIQKYKAKEGKYIYHDDAQISTDLNKYRIITFLWYLNDVNEGGETCFNGEFCVKPETGKLIFFPATWSYPHCGKMPISNDKYILTGWIFTDIN
jgi:hypothetical protein